MRARSVGLGIRCLLNEMSGLPGRVYETATRLPIGGGSLLTNFLPDAPPSLSVEKVIHDLFPLETPPNKPRFFGGVGRRIRRRSLYPRPARATPGRFVDVAVGVGPIGCPEETS